MLLRCGKSRCACERLVKIFIALSALGSSPRRVGREEGRRKAVSSNTKVFPFYISDTGTFRLIGEQPLLGDSEARIVRGKKVSINNPGWEKFGRKMFLFNLDWIIVPNTSSPTETTTTTKRLRSLRNCVSKNCAATTTKPSTKAAFSRSRLFCCLPKTVSGRCRLLRWHRRSRVGWREKQEEELKSGKHKAWKLCCFSLSFSVSQLFSFPFAWLPFSGVIWRWCKIKVR